MSCLVCQAARGDNEAKIIQRHSWNKHCISAEHCEAVRTREHRQAAAAATHQNYNKAYQSPAAALIHHMNPEVSQHIPSISAGSSEVEREYIRTESLSFTSEEQAHYFAPIDNETIQQHNENILREEFELLRLEANEQALDGLAEDASFPELADELRELGKS